MASLNQVSCHICTSQNWRVALDLDLRMMSPSVKSTLNMELCYGLGLCLCYVSSVTMQTSVKTIAENVQGSRDGSAKKGTRVGWLVGY